MPHYTVKVTVAYPVDAIDPKDALSTVPLVVRVKNIGTQTGLTQVLDETGLEVLTAILNPSKTTKDMATNPEKIKR